MVTDGTDPDVIRQTADNYVTAALQRRQTHLAVIQQGVGMISAGHNPRNIAEQLNARLGICPPEGDENERPVRDKRDLLSQEEVDSLLGAICEEEPASEPEPGEFESAIQRLAGRALQQVMRELPRGDLELALTATTQTTIGKVFDNLSSRSRRMLYEDMQAQYPAPAEQVAAAKERFLVILRRLEQAGEIILPPAAVKKNKAHHRGERHRSPK